MRDVVRLLLLTALRRDEVAYLTWGEVDIVNHRLVIPGERMKNGELHEVPLSAPAMALLKARMPEIRRCAISFSRPQLHADRELGRDFHSDQEGDRQSPFAEGPTLCLSRYSAFFRLAALGRIRCRCFRSSLGAQKVGHKCDL